MKAIVTGATGGLGRNLVKFLHSKGWDIVACGRDKEIGDSLGVEFNSFDLSDKELTIKYFKEAQVVFHCAALSSPWGSYDNFYKSNVQATKNVIEAMLVHGIKKLVHVSTPSIYFDFNDQFDIKESYVPKKFVNNYAKTKYEAEQIVLNSDIESVIIRPRGIFGEYDKVLIPRLEKIAKKGTVPLVKNKEVIVDVTYVGNVVYAMYLAGIKSVPTKSIFNITNDEPMNIKEIFSLLMDTVKIDTNYKSISYRTLMSVATLLELFSKFGFTKEPIITKYGIGLISKSQTLDITSAKEILGYKPKFTIKEGLLNYAKHRNI